MQLTNLSELSSLLVLDLNLCVLRTVFPKNPCFKPFTYFFYFIAILQWSIGHPSSASIGGDFWLELVVRHMMFSRIPPKQCASRWFQALWSWFFFILIGFQQFKLPNCYQLFVFKIHIKIPISKTDLSKNPVFWSTSSS
jgi:hypothetical protein